jgi:hypothetical protein
MMKSLNLIQCALMLLVILNLLACSNESGTGDNSNTETYDDPFAYCQAVGTIDAPDARYTGPQIPEAIAQGLRNAFNTPDTPLDIYMRGTFWRCMNGKVYACNVGANLPCESRANIDRTPTGALVDFCEQNTNADVIPMYVTGRETVYEWKCTNGAPEIVRQLVQPDERGFLSNIWYEISPG